VTHVDSLPSSYDPTGPCTHCGRISNFSSQGPLRIRDDVYAWLLTCQGCQSGVIVGERIIDATDASEHGHQPFYWWPTPGAGLLDPAVPEEVAQTYDEAMRCVAVQAYRAAAVMFRALLAIVVENKGSANAKAKSGLIDKLKQMSEDGNLHPSLASWAETIRLIGDGGFYPDELPESGQGEAEELGRFCRQVISVVYEVEARIARARYPED
jgi:hypothetical protein